MQKRRSTGERNSSSAVLPMTEGDIVAASSSTRRVRRKKQRKRKGRTFHVFGPAFCSALVVIVMVMLGNFVLQNFLGPKIPSTGTQETTAQQVEEDEDRTEPKQLPLSHFSSLSYALENADLVALYFAGSWCPMSTPVTDKLEAAFSHVSTLLLPPKGTTSSNSRYPLAIVYVSSDNSEEEMIKYSRRRWINVPFESEDRSEIKKHFRVCAKKELPVLDIERKFEIPTLLILDSLTHGVITTDGVNDLETRGPEALTHWQEMQHVVRGLEDKYLD